MQLLKLQYSLPQDTEVVNNINRLEKDGDRFMEKNTNTGIEHDDSVCNLHLRNFKAIFNRTVPTWLY